VMSADRDAARRGPSQSPTAINQCEANGAYDDLVGRLAEVGKIQLGAGAFCLPEADNCGVDGGKGQKADAR